MADRPTDPRELLSSRGPIVENLARELHAKMEHLDPTTLPEWDEMTDADRAFYVRCVEHLLGQEELLRAALG